MCLVLELVQLLRRLLVLLFPVSDLFLELKLILLLFVPKVALLYLGKGEAPFHKKLCSEIQKKKSLFAGSGLKRVS